MVEGLVAGAAVSALTAVVILVAFLKGVAVGQQQERLRQLEEAQDAADRYVDLAQDVVRKSPDERIGVLWPNDSAPDPSAGSGHVDRTQA